MNRIFQTIFIFAILISCTTNQDRKVKFNEKIIESSISKNTIGQLSVASLIDSGLIISVNKYKITCTINRHFKGLQIPIKICATVEPNGFGNIDSFILNYDGSTHNLRSVEYFIQSPQEIIAIKNSENYGVRFEDYNFDKLPDIAIYNSASGMKNIIEDIFIYSKAKKRFIYNNILSENPNCTVDTSRNLIETFGQGGMASMIYNSETYKWEGEKLKMIKSVNQDYSDELNLFIKKTKDLIDTSWVTSIDTLTEAKILEMREEK